MNRVLAFFLGMLFGIVFLLGTLGIGIYAAATIIKPKTIASGSSQYLGTLADMTVLEMADSLSTLYSSKIGVTDENGRYFTVAELFEYYHIDATAVFGGELPDAVMELPAFELLQDGGLNKALNQISMCSLMDIVGNFTGSNPSQEMLNELAPYSVGDLFNSEKGIKTVFQNIRMSDILPNAFPDADSDNLIMWAIGQTKIGQLLEAMSSNNSIFTQFNEGGAFAELGTVPIADLLGGTGAMLNFLGEVTLADLIDDNGAVNVDGVLGSLYLGTILGCMRYEITDIQTYFVNTQYSNANERLYEKHVGNETVYAKLENDTYYEVDMLCQENHMHDIYCFNFVWYNQRTHTGVTPGDYIDAEGGRHARVSGIYKALVNRKVQDMMNGSSDAIIKEIEKLKIGELFNNNITGIMANFADMSIYELLHGGIDTLRLGAILNFTRNTADAPQTYNTLTDGVSATGYVAHVGSKYVLSDDCKNWYDAKLICEETHIHNSRDCYSYIWYQNGSEAGGLAGKLADFKVKQLSSLESTLSKLTLRDVFGSDEMSGLMESLADIPLGNLSNEIDRLYLGNIMSCMRRELTNTSGYTTMSISTATKQLLQKQVGSEHLYAIADSDGVTYEAIRICHNKNITHNHTADCYNFAWYNTLGHNVSNGDDVLFASDNLYHSRITGVYKALVSLKLGDLTNGSSDTLMREIKKLALSDLMGESSMTGVIASMADMSIEELMSGGVENVYLGTFFNFVRRPANTPVGYTTLNDGLGHYTYISSVGTQYFMSENGTEWYYAQLVCTDSHTHNARACYSYTWYKACTASSCTNPTHTVINGVAYNEAEGMMFKLADEKVEDLHALNTTIQTFTLGDVLGNNLTGMLAELQDTPLVSISSAVRDIYLGSAVGDYRKAYDNSNIDTLFPTLIDKNSYDSILVRTDGTTYVKSDEHGKKWYVAELECSNAYHTSESQHTESCYEYIWYTNEACTVPVTGITKAFVNAKLNNVNETLTTNIKKLTLKDIGISCTGNNILTALENVPLSEISSQINGLRLGVVLGYTKKSTTVPDGTFDAICTIYGKKYMLDADGKYYEAELNCTNAAHTSDQMHTASCYCFVWYESLSPEVRATGINAKMSNTTIQELGNGGLTNVVKNMTIGELSDSGMLNLSEMDMYKLDILFDQSNLTNIAEYQASRRINASVTAKSYYISKHGDDQTYRGYWKSMKLQDFLSGILSVL